MRPGTCWLLILRMHFHIGSGQCIVSLDFHFIQKWAAKEQKTCDFHTFCYVSCPHGRVAPNIENRSLLYIFLGFKAHRAKNRTRIAYATVENGCVKNRHLVIVSGVAMDTTSPAPEKKCAPQNKSAPRKKSRRAFGASATLARRRLSNNKTKFERRTEQNVAAASAVSNTERAIERGRRTLDKQHRPFYLGGHRAQQQRLRH